MRVLVLWIFLPLSLVYGNYEAGKAAATSSVNRTHGSLRDASLLKAKRIPVSERPSEASLYNNDKLQRASETQKHNHENFRRILNSQRDRLEYTFDVDATLQRAQETVPTEEGGFDRSFRKTCRRSGMSYTQTCRRERIVNIEVIPEIRKRNPSFCLGHWNRWGTSKSHCGGCRGGDEYIERHKSVTILRDEWVGCEVEESLRDAGVAELESLEPGPVENPRMIQGEPIGGEIWEENRIYRIGINTFDQCASLRALGCVDKGGRCVQTKELPDGQSICLEYEHSFDCPTGKSKTRFSKPFKVTGMEAPSYEGNKQMGEALARIEALKQASDSMENSFFGGLTIFGGKRKRCTTNFGGAFKDCCKGAGGVGVNLRLATECSVEEKELSDWRGQGRCIFVGQHQKVGTFGMNISKEYVYCCFPTKLARIIQQGGKPQINRAFGTAENPDCRGFTPSELQRLNFSRLDLSELFADIAQSAQLATQTLQRDYAQKQRSLERDVERKTRQLTQEKNQRPERSST